MSAILCSPIPTTATNPSDLKEFFDPATELPKINEFISDRECPDSHSKLPTCKVNLVFGFFFDGKNNNLDILAADRELADEVKLFNNCRKWKKEENTNSPPAPFNYNEWGAIQTYWDLPAPSTAITDLFDNYVHDSRAWFKPFGTDVVDLLIEMEALEASVEKIEAWEKNPVGPKPAPLTKADYDKVTRYRPYRNTADACTAAGFVSHGREGHLLQGGFLRYRKIYMGNDRFIPEGAVYVQVQPAESQYPVAEMSDSSTLEQHA